MRKGQGAGWPRQLAQLPERLSGLLIKHTIPWMLKDVEVLAVARVGVEPEHGINIVLVSKRDPPKNLSEDLDATVDNALGENIKVRVAILKGTVDDYLQEVN